MTISTKEVINQLENLAAHCQSMIEKDDPESIWRDDLEALNAAIGKLGEEFSGNNAAEIILQIMEKENVNQTELAARMGCVRQNVSQMLNRGTVNMRYDSLLKMAGALGYEIVLRKTANRF